MKTVKGTSMESVIIYSLGGVFPRISETIEHILDSRPEIIFSAFDYLKHNFGEEYEQVLEQGILEIGCGHSYPNEKFFREHPLKYYLGIDLAKNIGNSKMNFGDSIGVLHAGVDAFSFLNGLPDESIPYVFMASLDAYILNGEGKKLSGLLEKKVRGKIFVVDSAVQGNKVRNLHL